MDSRQIYAALKSNKRTKHCFHGIYPMDMLPDKSNLWSNTSSNKQYIIVNTDPSYKPGEHWIALCLSKNGKHNEYFDSYGQAPNIKIAHYLNDNYLFLTKPMQGFLTTTCGQWCMYYILHKCFGGSFSELASSLDMLDTPLERDSYVNQIVSREFPIKEPIVDLDFLINQISQGREMKKKRADER